MIIGKSSLSVFYQLYCDLLVNDTLDNCTWSPFPSPSHFFGSD